MEAKSSGGCVCLSEGPVQNGADNRLIGVATHANTHDHVKSLSDLAPQMTEEIGALFQHYNRLAGKAFEPFRRSDASHAMTLLRKHGDVREGLTAICADLMPLTKEAATIRMVDAALCALARHLVVLAQDRRQLQLLEMVAKQDLWCAGPGSRWHRAVRPGAHAASPT